MSPFRDKSELIILRIYYQKSMTTVIHQVKRYCAKRYRAKQRYRATFFGLNLARYRFQGRKFNKLYKKLFVL